VSPVLNNAAKELAMIEEFDRRKFLQTVGGAGASLVLGGPALEATSVNAGFGVNDPFSTPLRLLAEHKWLLFGCSATPGDFGDQQFKDVAAQQCNIMTPGLQMKMDALRPAPDSYNFGPADDLVKFTQQHNMKVHGHTLVWFRALPGWFDGYANQQNAQQLMLSHINTVVGHYAGKIHSWDVINEALSPSDNRPDGLRNSPWLDFIGPDYIEMAFRAAAAADPHAILCWNEYGIENETPDHVQKRGFFLQHLKELQRRGVPISGIGVQSHLDATSPKFSGSGFDEFLHEISDMGLKIVVTELDATDSLPNADVPTRNKLVASRYKQYLDTVLKHTSVVAVIMWGISDKHTWLNGNYRFPRKDGAPFVPLPFDASYNAKPQWYAIAEAIDDAPPRPHPGT
jgi:endo-1,4-beta-xylanase